MIADRSRLRRLVHRWTRWAYVALEKIGSARLCALEAECRAPTLPRPTPRPPPPDPPPPLRHLLPPRPRPRRRSCGPRAALPCRPRLPRSLGGCPSQRLGTQSMRARCFPRRSCGGTPRASSLGPGSAGATLRRSHCFSTGAGARLPRPHESGWRNSPSPSLATGSTTRSSSSRLAFIWWMLRGCGRSASSSPRRPRPRRGDCCLGGSEAPASPPS